MKRKVLMCLQAAAIACAVGFAFAPAFRGGWLWDDTPEVAGNPDLRSLAGLGRIWMGTDGADYFPLKSTVQWIQWHLWGDHVLGYHLTNAGLHLLGALLLWRLLGRLGVRLAWLGGLVFAVHPLAVESVAWISELKNTLSFPFLLLAFGAWLDFCGEPSTEGGGGAGLPRRHHLLALAWFAAAMLCKSSVVMFPCVLLLHAWWRRGRIARADLAACAPFLALSLVLGLVTVWFQHNRAMPGAGAIPPGGIPFRLAGAGLAAGFYLLKWLAPVGLLPMYPRWPADPPTLLQFVPLAGLAVALAWFWTRRRGWGRHALFGAGFFLLNLLPVLGFIPMAYLRISRVADHFAYLPLAGLCGLAAAGAGTLWNRLDRTARGPWRTAAFAGGIALICGLLAWQSRRYSAVFQDETRLWTYTLGRNPTAWMARNNLGNALARNGRPAEAVLQYEAALALLPSSPQIHLNLGDALMMLRRLPEAAAAYGEALRLLPDYAAAHANLGYALVGMGRLAEAVPHLEQALRSRPDDAECEASLALALAHTPGRLSDALVHYRRSLRLRPGSPETRSNFGGALAQSGRMADAIAQYGEAVRIRPDYTEARYNLAIALGSAGRTGEAMDQLREVLRLSPGRADAHFNLGVMLVNSGRPGEAVPHFEEALKADPGDGQVRRDLALALRAAGRAHEGH